MFFASTSRNICPARSAVASALTACLFASSAIDLELAIDIFRLGICALSELIWDCKFSMSETLAQPAIIKALTILKSFMTCISIFTYTLGKDHYNTKTVKIGVKQHGRIGWGTKPINWEQCIFHRSNAPALECSRRCSSVFIHTQSKSYTHKANGQKPLHHHRSR